MKAGENFFPSSSTGTLSRKKGRQILHFTPQGMGLVEFIFSADHNPMIGVTKEHGKQFECIDL